MKQYSTFFIALLAWLIIATKPVNAHTATRYFDVQVEKTQSKGDAKNIEGILILKNLFEKEAFFIRAQIAAPVINKDKRRKSFVSNKIEIGPGAQTEIKFNTSLYSDGKHIVNIKILVMDKDGVQIGHQHKDLYFQVRSGKYKRVSYEELYVPKEPKIDAPKEIGFVASATVKLDPSIEIVSLASENSLDFNKRRLKHLQLPKNAGSGVNEKNDEQTTKPGQKVDLGSLKFRKSPQQLKKSSLLKNKNPGDRATPIKQEDQTSKSDSNPTFLQLASSTLGIQTAHAATTYRINGRFTYRGLDNTYHPGWNWFVEVWWKKSNNRWSKLGAKYIAWDGRWSMDLNKNGFEGQNIHVFYRPGGYYLMPQNHQEESYWWKDPVWNNISTNYSIGNRSVDLSSNGTLAGLGDVYHSGLLYWHKFYSNNLNPERDNAIKLFFPNTWFDCNDLNWNDVDSNTWSCAWEDRVWLIPAHSDQYTIQHELGHQLMNEYWNGQGPDGAGGAHTLSRCYNDGLALSEGFANAAPIWVLSGENANSPTPGGFNIESPPSSTCNGDTNELWVAAIFWDLLDRRSDGDDRLYFRNAAEVFSHVLRNGKKNGIREYRSIYRNAASQGHQGLIDDIYEHNTVPVP